MRLLEHMRILLIQIIVNSFCSCSSIVDEEEERMLGLDTGNPAADHEAGMWIAALIGNNDSWLTDSHEKLIV